MQKSVVFLHTNNKAVEREIKETIASKRKNLGINLTKEMKDLYFENYKTSMKEIEDNTNKWKDLPCSWNEIPIKISIILFTELD